MGSAGVAMNRYLLFSGSTYYPSGGARDFVGSCETLDNAIWRARRYVADQDHMCDWWNVLDIETGEIAASCDRDGCENWQPRKPLR